MEIDKSQIVEFLKSKGDHDNANKAEAELPNKVDPEQDRGLLSGFGVDPAELLGGSGLGKLLGG